MLLWCDNLRGNRVGGRGVASRQKGLSGRAGEGGPAGTRLRCSRGAAVGKLGVRLLTASVSLVMGRRQSPVPPHPPPHSRGANPPEPVFQLTGCHTVADFTSCLFFYLINYISAPHSCGCELDVFPLMIMRLQRVSSWQRV